MAYNKLVKNVAEMKLASGCKDCGYNGSADALQFDHLPGFTKLADVSDLTSRGKRKRAMQEIAKCEVVCANCHAVRTCNRRKRKDTYRTVKEDEVTVKSLWPEL
jgi:hypothetical protein